LGYRRLNMGREEDPPRRGFEFVVNDPEELISFYRFVFGYDVLTQQPDTGQWYVHIRAPDLRGNIVEETRPVRKTYHAESPYLGSFYVDDVQSKLELVKAKDGRLFLEPDELQPVRDTKWSKHFLCCDPENNMFGMVEYVNSHLD
jgi:predicted enzyme related to lactoylglutathione lyase